MTCSKSILASYPCPDLYLIASPQLLDEETLGMRLFHRVLVGGRRKTDVTHAILVMGEGHASLECLDFNFRG